MRALFVNACILFTLTCVGFFPFRNQGVSNKRTKLLLGFITGVSGNILMFFSLRLEGNTILDLRVIPVVVAASYGGVLSSLPSAILIGAGRVLLLGVNSVSYKGAVSIILMGIITPLLSRFIKKQPYKTLLLYVYCLVQVSVFIRHVSPNLFVIYYILVIVMGFLVQFIIYTLKHYFDLQAELKQLSELDFLTGLVNARQFDYGLKYVMQSSKERFEPFSLLMIDVDKFKSINDTYGHSVGDSVLKQTATLLKMNCRPGDIVSRKGGEEFAIILPSCSIQLATDVAECIRNAVENHQFDEQLRFTVTVSIGVATSVRLLAPEQLIDLADKALYEAKNNGRNKVCTA
ncbi:diguanylate cyclase [Alicyclobacillus fastidiosus]|uniref:Diguanylate cyclase n=1 Tax=Alicyclobacillus fastidiosus TaxID=392011 RepID=A0ABY6ZF69_9BACL|nr:diguanylate cyclase [Alicyclobacillus fastidiosus]WAH41208.1 diguanylate cyclase [Alicyclobacillus fastidiosus]GMA62788.1 hypothetical protein GCM10025859_32280 [Alicyclobacillus fastidiosus]